MNLTYEPLRHILTKRDISYRQLRRDLGLHESMTNRLKNDSGYVTLKTIDLLCEYLDVNVSDVIAVRR